MIDFFLPIGVVELLLVVLGHTKGFVCIRVLAVVTFDKVYKLVASHYFLRLVLLTDGNTTIIAYLRTRALATFLRGDDDDTIGTTATIDSSCRSIFKYCETFNVGRVHHREGVGKTFHTLVVHGQTINHNQRIIGSIQRRTTTDANSCTCTRSSTACGHIDTRDFTLNHILSVDNNTLILLIWLDGSHRTSHVVLLCNTITDDNRFVQTIFYLFQYDVKRLAFPFHFETLIADIRDTENLPLLDSFYCEVTFGVYCCTVGRTFHNH